MVASILLNFLKFTIKYKIYFFQEVVCYSFTEFYCYCVPRTPLWARHTAENRTDKVPDLRDSSI